MAALTPAAPIAVTFFMDYAAAEKRQRVIALEELAVLIRDSAAPAKAQLPWLKLARFGNARTPRNSLRHDRNVIAITGIEADYDGGEVSFDDAIDIADKAGLLAILYTSPSHMAERPRWRILAPASREYPPTDRARLLGRLNGLYRGIFARESWTLSQAYYYGHVDDGALGHRVEVVDGEPIDQLHDLDLIAIGPPTANVAGARSASDLANGAEARRDAELVRRILTGDGYHSELTALAARYIGRGMDPRAAAETLRGLMLSHLPEARDDRWRDRIGSIPAIVRSAAEKFAPEAQRRRALAKFTHRLVRQPTTTGAQIKSAILAEAVRLGITAGAGLAIGGGIVRDYEAKRHARRR
jgi:hypothetical protein